MPFPNLDGRIHHSTFFFYEVTKDNIRVSAQPEPTPSAGVRAVACRAAAAAPGRASARPMVENHDDDAVHKSDNPVAVMHASRRAASESPRPHILEPCTLLYIVHAVVVELVLVGPVQASRSRPVTPLRMAATVRDSDM